MILPHTLEIAFLSLAHHAFRSFLAALGVVLGVGAVVAMLAISEGARQESMDAIRKQGIDNIIVVSQQALSGSATSGSRSQSRGQSRYDVYGVKMEDMRHIRLFENVEQVVPVRDLRQTLYVGGRASSVRLVAVAPEFMDITRSGSGDSRGRWLLPEDGENRSMTCVLGSAAASELFGLEDPLGKYVSAGRSSFRVVGVLHNRYDGTLAKVHSLNKLMYVHYDVAQACYGEVVFNLSSYRWTKVAADYLYIKVKETSQIPNTAARLRAYFQSSHEVEDWQLIVPYDLMIQARKTQQIFTIVMASISAISLLVGGIGIMNIMLANVYERTREIGTLRALGARRGHVLAQFLAEAVVLTTTGGLLGLLLGYGLAGLVERYAGMHTNVTPLNVVVAVSVSLAVGIAFGTYPAWKAANLPPTEALRRQG